MRPPAAAATMSLQTPLVPSPAGVVPYSALVRQFHAEPRGKLYCLHGSRFAFRIALSAAAQLLLRGIPVALVDGTNRFDPYFIAEFARRVSSRGGPPPAALLDRIYVSRAFTCYQMEAAVTEKLPSFIARAGVPVAILFGPLDTFYDDQAPFFEVQAGVERMIGALRRLRDNRIGVLTASEEVRLASRERSRLFPRLAAAMDNVFRVTEAEGRPRILLEQLPRPQAGAPQPVRPDERRLLAPPAA